MAGGIKPSMSPPPPAETADNPCWGGPEPSRHDLEYLLRVLGSTAAVDARVGNPFASREKYDALMERVRRRLVIYQDENYVAINKPPDLRMDGPHRATVHKLLLYLFPPPSIRQIVSPDEASGNASSSDTLGTHRHLLQSIAPLSKRNFLKDDPHRNIHQLDYATSGVLLFGENKRATGTASQAFEHRKTDKRYVAVVINPSTSESNKPPLGADFFEGLPEMPFSSLDCWADGSLENRYRKKRRRDMDERDAKRGTFEGYMPTQSIFDKWRASLVRERKKASQQGVQINAPKKWRGKAPNDLPALPNPQRELSSEEVEEMLSLGPSYKKVKSHCARSGKDWTTICEVMKEEYNQTLVEYYAGKDPSGKAKGSSEHEGDSQKPGSNLPPLFRIQSESNPSETAANDGSTRPPETFYICASIGEPKDGHFHVIVDPSVSNQAQLSSSLPDLDLKPSLTKCTILWRGNMRAGDERIPVAKVLLQPWTGRRHQLRVHLAHVAGFPILGDATYGGTYLDSDEASNERGAVCGRMCLHAKELSIPLLGDETKTFVAPDPFVTVKEDGCEDERLLIS